MPKNFIYHYVRFKVTGRKEGSLEEKLEAVCSSEEEKLKGEVVSSEEGVSSFSFEEEDKGDNPQDDFIAVSFFVGVRLDALLYKEKAIRDMLGLYKIEDLDDNDKKVSLKTIRNYSNATALGVVGSVYATFRAVNPQTFD